MSLWGKGWMYVGPWWVMLLAAPGAAAWILEVRWQGCLVNRGCLRPASTTCFQRHDGVVVLVDPGAQKAPPQAALRLRLQGGHLSREKLVLLFIGTPVPAARRHAVPRPLATQALHVGNHLCLLAG